MTNTTYSWKELSKELMQPNPRSYFDNLLEQDKLAEAYPEIYQLKTALESRRWHPEGDAYEHTMLVLTQAAQSSYGLTSRLACLVHDFGKAVSPRKTLPKHYGHEVKGIPIVSAFAKRIGVPEFTTNVVVKTTRYHMNMHRLDKLNPKTIVHMFNDMGARDTFIAVYVLLKVGKADAKGRLGFENANVEHLNLLYDYYEAYKTALSNPNNLTQKEFMDCVNAVNNVKLTNGR